MIKTLDASGVKILYDLLSLQDYPNNEVLAAVINAIDQTKADQTDLDQFQSSFSNLEAFVKPIGAAGVFIDNTALTVSVGELATSTDYVENNSGLKYYKVSTIIPSMAELKKGFNVITCTKTDVQNGDGLDFERMFYGIEVLPEAMSGSSFYNNVTLYDSGIIGVYLDKILIVPATATFNDIIFTPGLYFAYEEATGFSIAGLRVNGFTFHNNYAIGKALDAKLDKNTIFIGTREQYQIALTQGKVPTGALVCITDD